MARQINFPVRCDVCGRFIGYRDLVSGEAYRRLDTPDSEFTAETYVTRCRIHNPQYRLVAMMERKR